MVTRSTIYYPPRSDGGPYFILRKGRNEFGNQMVEVFFTDVPSGRRKGRFKQGKLLEVSKQRLKIYPLVIREDVADYLTPVYEPITHFVFDNDSGALPKDMDGVQEVLQQLPAGFGKIPDLGLTVRYEYRFILNGTASRHQRA